MEVKCIEVVSETGVIILCGMMEDRRFGKRLSDGTTTRDDYIS